MKRSAAWWLVAMCVLGWSGVSAAQEAPQAPVEGEEAAREEAMFGEEAPAEEPAEQTRDEGAMFGGDEAPAKPPTDPVPKTQDERLSGGGEAASEADIAALIGEADRELALGGYLLMQPTARITEGQAWADDALGAANLLDLYLDARPNERVRAYVRGRLLYDYTVQDQAQAQAAGLDLSTGTLGGAGGLTRTQQQVRAQLDQLWVKFDIARTVYVTVGRQRIRWGAGRFWNPTDFLNLSQINPLALFDARLGVDLIKLHLPIESLGWNLYAIGALGGANQLGDVGGALRAELVFGQTEVSVSGQVRRQTFGGPQPIEPFYTPKQTWPNTTTPVRLGLDVSSALGPLDVKGELALTRGSGQAFYRGELDLSGGPLSLKLPEDYSREDEWIVQAVGGFEWLISYGDDDMIALSAEYFYNQAGYDSSDLYLWTILQGGFTPLYMGRHYAALGVALPGPGSWNDTTFVVSAIGNLSDKSFINRFDYRVRVLDDLNVGAFMSVQYGENGELFYRIDIPPVPGDETLVNGLSIPPARVTLGGSVQLTF